jgi:hypothetical protein
MNNWAIGLRIGNDLIRIIPTDISDLFSVDPNDFYDGIFLSLCRKVRHVGSNLPHRMR